LGCEIDDLVGMDLIDKNRKKSLIPFMAAPFLNEKLL